MTFADGYKASELEVVGTVGKRNTGTSVYFSPDPKYFDSPKFSISRLKHVLKAKAVLCPGLLVSFEDKASGEKVEWHYEDGLRSYRSIRSASSCVCPTSRSAAASRATRRRSTGPCYGCPRAATASGKLCQPDPHRPGRHARQWAAPGAAGCDARVLRVSQPAAAWRQAGARGCLGAHHLRLVHEDAGATVLWPDQGAPVIPRGGGVRFRRGQGCVQPVAQCPPRAGHAIGGAGHQQRWASSEGEQEGRTQAHHPRPGTAWQAGRLRRPGPDACRAVPGRR